MKSDIKNYWKLTFIVSIVFILAGCAGQSQEAAAPTAAASAAPATAVPESGSEIAANPTAANIPPTEPLPALPAADAALGETPAALDETPAEPEEPAQTATAAPTATALPQPTQIPCEGVLTSPQQEGPYFSPGSPERVTLIEEGMPGVPVLITGRVFDQDCNPVPGAKLDFWLADVDGEYDNVGYTLRGHVFTDENGYYTLESIEPTSYTGRPPHIHVKVAAPGGQEILTTQMYFAGSEASAEVTNSPELFVAYQGADAAGRLQVLFNFLVNY